MVVEEGGGGGLAGSRGRGRVWVGVYIALRHVGLWYYIYSQLFGKRDRCILDLKLATTKSPLIVLQLIHGSFIALERREIRGAEFIGEGESQPSMLQHMVK